MIDAIWDFYQHHYPQHSKLWLHNKKRRIIGYHTPRYWYIDNTNLERCGLKIKYENIFPKNVSIQPRHEPYGGHGGRNYGRRPYNGYANFHDQEEAHREQEFEDMKRQQEEEEQQEQQSEEEEENFGQENINDDITDRFLRFEDNDNEKKK